MLAVTMYGSVFACVSDCSDGGDLVCVCVGGGGVEGVLGWVLMGEFWKVCEWLG